MFFFLSEKKERKRPEILYPINNTIEAHIGKFSAIFIIIIIIIAIKTCKSFSVCTHFNLSDAVAYRGVRRKMICIIILHRYKFIYL